MGEDAQHAEEQRIHSELRSNGYPEPFIRRAASRSKRKKRTNDPYKQEVRATACIPYVAGVSEAIRRVLSSLSIRTVMKPKPWKWTLMRGAKDRVPPLQDPGVVYAIGCQDCREVYVGETGRTAQQRAREHKCHTRCGRIELSAIAKHAHDEGHNIYWEPRIVAKETNAARRKVKEALAIRKLQRAKGAMNQDVGMNLSTIWLDLV